MYLFQVTLHLYVILLLFRAPCQITLILHLTQNISTSSTPCTHCAKLIYRNFKLGVYYYMYQPRDRNSVLRVLQPSPSTIASYIQPLPSSKLHKAPKQEGSPRGEVLSRQCAVTSKRNPRSINSHRLCWSLDGGGCTYNEALHACYKRMVSLGMLGAVFSLCMLLTIPLCISASQVRTLTLQTR